MASVIFVPSRKGMPPSCMAMFRGYYRVLGGEFGYLDEGTLSTSMRVHRPVLRLKKPCLRSENPYKV